MPDPLAFSLAEFAAAASVAGVPDQVLEDMKARFLDVLGNALAAHGDDAFRSVERVADRIGGTSEASVIGGGGPGRLPAANAALVNGTLAHSLDFDDTHLPSVLHPSASVIPAVLGVAEAVGADGRTALTAAAIGDEVCVRLGMASYDPQLRNSIFFENGLHATSICGTIASAIAAGVLLGFDTDRLAHAIGIAASLGAGLLEANRTGGSVKRIHCGWAAHSGIVAAQLAEAGLTGPPTVLEGRFGFFRAYSEGRFDVDQLVGGLGSRWETLRVHFKPYPSNHFTHPGIDAALALRKAGLDPADIKSLELGLPAPAMRTIAEPPELKARPQSPHNAKFSAPYTVASALCGGGGLGIGHEDFTVDAIADPERLRLSALVSCYVDEEATASFPHRFLAVLTARLSDGSAVEHRVLTTRGGPDRPLSRAELETKYRVNVRSRLPDEAAERILKAVWQLESLSEVTALLRMTGASRESGH